MNANKTYLKNYIEDRLNEYGYAPQMDPGKYNSYSAVRRLVSLRLGIDGRSALSDAELQQAYELVDQMIPAKEDKATMSKVLNLPLTQEEANVMLIQLVSRIDTFHENLTQAGARGDAMRCVEITEYLKVMTSIQEKLLRIGARLELE